MAYTEIEEGYFDDIRPIRDEEVQTVVRELLADPEAGPMLKQLIKEPAEGTKSIQDINTVHDLKGFIIASILRELLSKTAFSYTSSGKSGLDGTGETKYTFITNHRDIILDSAILNLVMLDAGMPMPEIAIGDNLLLRPWIRQVVRLAGAFIVKRSVGVREMLAESKKLSAYMRRNIEEGRASQWIAQREGRAKDADDRTQQSVLKMLAMSAEGGESPLEALLALNMVPVTFSYEYDPCDYLKALELLQKARGTYKKEEKISDLLSMQTGLTGFKGRIHVAVGDPLSTLVEGRKEELSALPKNDQYRAIAEIIDENLFAHYRFYPCNYIAYDLLHGGRLGEGLYSKRERLKFELYLEDQLDKLRDFKEAKGEREFLYTKLLEMYSNPLKNNRELKKAKGE